MGLFKRKKRMFGEIAIAKGLATKEDIEEALTVQRELFAMRKIQRALGAILQDKGVLSMDDVNSVLDEQKRSEGLLVKGFVYSLFHSGYPK
jgi:hypothetical protein